MPGDAENGLSQNEYLYALNDPVSFIDPDGTAPMLAAAGIGALAGGLIGSGYYVLTHRGDFSWKGLAKYALGGAVIGGGLGAGAVYVIATKAAASWAMAQGAIPAGANSYAIGKAFEKWYYNYYQISDGFRQAYSQLVRGFIDAQIGNRLIELKNYDWSKYSSYGGLASKFVAQALKYSQLIGENVNGHIIKRVEFIFSSKPPKPIIDALISVGVKVSWIK